MKTCFLALLFISLHRTLHKNVNIFQSLNILVLVMAVTPEISAYSLMTTTSCGLGGRGIKLQKPVINLIHRLPAQCVEKKIGCKSKKSSKFMQLRQMLNVEFDRKQDSGP